MKLKDKVAVITGGTSGIGAAMAREFKAEGAFPVVAGRDPKALRAAARELGRDALAVQCNVTNMSDLDRLVEETVGRFKGIDIIVANAGILRVVPMEAVDEPLFDEVMDTNLKGAYFLIQKALPHVRKGGCILLVSSITAHLGFPGNSLYAATKGALRAMSRSLSAELLKRGIRVNVISPGPIDTPLFDRRAASGDEGAATKTAIAERTPLGRLGTPEEVAKAAVFLCSSDGGYIVGEDLVIDGGWTNLYQWD